MKSENFLAPIITNKEDLESIFILIKSLLSENMFIPRDFDMNEFDVYYYIKSHRSNVTEGNTTTIGEFTELINHRLYSNDIDYVVPNKVSDETFEIDNLKSAYQFLSENNNVTTSVIQSVHRILGTNIYKNNFCEHRGKLKRKNNFVPFNYKGVSYRKYFTDCNKVKEVLQQFILDWNELDDCDCYGIFSKFMILQIQLISIHPFEDGNGRVSRAISESYIENKGYYPYTPYKNVFKKDYQNMMGEFSVLSINSLSDAYEYITEFFVSKYNENVDEIIASVEKMLKTI